MNNNLVYYCVGRESDYLEMLKFSILTLKNINLDQDVLVITNDETLISDKFVSGVDVFYVKEDNPKKLKTKIFDYVNIENYSKIIYLDCDIVVNTIIYRIFESIIDEDKIYAPIEQYNFEAHNLSQFGFQDYTNNELEFFENNNIYPFNSGTFGFNNNLKMRENFKEIENLIESKSENKKYIDQPAFNFIFNKKNLVGYDTFKTNENYFFMEWNESTVNYVEKMDGIFHFYSYAPSIKEKIKSMIVFYFVNL